LPYASISDAYTAWQDFTDLHNISCFILQHSLHTAHQQRINHQRARQHVALVHSIQLQLAAEDGAAAGTWWWLAKACRLGQSVVAEVEMMLRPRCQEFLNVFQRCAVMLCDLLTAAGLAKPSQLRE
jgi:hypothetical protein